MEDNVDKWMNRIDKVMNIVGIVVIVGSIWIIAVLLSQTTQ